MRQFLDDADVIFGVGCSFGETNFGVQMPKGKIIIHATIDPKHLNKDIEARVAKGNAPQHYVFTMIATDLDPKELKPGLTRPQLLESLRGHNLAAASLVLRFVNP